MKIITKSEKETINLAIEFANTLLAKDVVLLDGELGAGKTCFVRGMCEGLGGDPTQVNSPTFTIMQDYDIADGKRLVHIDAYRLSGEEELESIGWDELLHDQEVIVAIEWPCKITNALPENSINVSIQHLQEHQRVLTIDQPSSGDIA